MAAQSDDGAAAGGPPLATAADIYNIYALTLGRTPESAEVVASMAGAERDILVRAFFGSDEHATNVLTPVEEGRRLSGPLFDQAPGEDLVRWLAGALPLTAEGVEAIGSAGRSWHRLFQIVFADETFLAFAGPAHAERRRALPFALGALAALEGAVERLTAEGLKGWVVAPDRPGARLSVEARVGGRVVAVGAATEFRREVQERFGGAGLAGFTLMLDEALRADPRRPVVEVFERQSGLFVGSLTLSARSAPLSAHAQLIREVAEARRLLERIEAALPAVQSDLAFDLDAYADWYEAYLRPAAPPAPPARSDRASRILVSVDARGVAPAWVADLLESIEVQTLADWSVIVVGEGAALTDLVTRTAWRSGRPAELLSPEAAAEPERLADGLEAVVRLSAPVVLEAGALEAALAALAAGDRPSAVFWDEDVLEDQPLGTAPWARRRRRLPWFKSAFDLDLLRQEPATGSALALGAEAARAIGEGAWSAREGSEIALLLAEAGRAPRHLPRLLNSRQRPHEPDPEAWAAVVQAHLDRVSPGDRAVARPDPLGAPAAVSVEAARPLSGVTATVIVPTRDRLDLLKPCVDSLLAAAGANSVAMDLLIVDHLSEDPATLDYINARVAAGEARVMRQDGAFNWALMNNLAAAETDAEVLVFLNNDTAVVTPDWLDRLCRQALRPGVGAVGARLIYADGAIQHAGFVARPLADSFVMPEGIGAAGSDGGYLGRHARLRRTAAVTGACMAVRADVFRRLGGFDAANLPIDWNDIDFCLKARAEDLAVVYEPAAVLYHFESRSRGVTRDGERLAASTRAAGLVFARWGERFGEDGDYAAPFDRPGVPFSRLRPPPSRHGSKS